jgi:parallel beta-helix repeat protein
MSKKGVCAMKRFTYRTTVALALGLGLTLTLLYALNAHPRPALAAPVDLFAQPVSRTAACTMDQPCTLQTALNKAVDGDSIYLAGGTYTGSGGAVVTLTKSINLYGGWDGAALKGPVRDPDLYPSILDGEGQRRVVYISGNYTPTLDGLWITNGSAGISGGGGISSDMAHPIISGCHVYSNTAGDDGGGIYLGSADYAQLTGNAIYSNTAGTGGGLCISDSEGVKLADNDIYSNTASAGGGLAIIYSRRIELADNSFHLNTATTIGGGVQIRDSIAITLTSNWLYWNQADVAGGGLFLEEDADVNLINTMVVANRIFPVPGQGAGMAIQDTDVHLWHTTIALNIGGNAQGVYAVGIPTTVWMTNTILAGHWTGVETSGGAVTMTHTLWGSGVWANSIDTKGSNITTGTANIWGDPDFVDPMTGDFHIGAHSAAIGQGTSTFVTTDIDGDLRSEPSTLGADEGKRSTYVPLLLQSGP